MVDGTPCYQGRVSRDICINGICKVCGIVRGFLASLAGCGSTSRSFLAFSRLRASPCPCPLTLRQSLYAPLSLAWDTPNLAPYSQPLPSYPFVSISCLLLIPACLPI